MTMHIFYWRYPLTALLLCIALTTSFSEVFAECGASVPLSGSITIDKCNSKEEECIPGYKAIYDYSEAAKCSPNAFTITLHGNSWRLYDGAMRIINVEEVAEMVKSKLKSEKTRLILIASWSGIPPDNKTKSLAQRLSDSLAGFPVSGMDGFVWLSKDGAVRTTRHAFTRTQKNYPYSIRPGEEVMVSLVKGWYIDFEEDYFDKGNANGLLHAGAGWDIFMLCPDKALKSFEKAAKLSHPIASYNAAIIRLERGNAGDHEAAIALLKQAAELGDEKSKSLLEKLQK